MKALKEIYILLILLSSFHQSSNSQNRLENQSVYIKKSNGAVIKIQGEICSEHQDSVIVTVQEITNNNSSIIQNFKTACSFPLELTEASVNGQKGIFIKYDPAARNGNCFLYLFNEETNRLQKVKGFRNLGTLNTIIYNGIKYNYSYSSCGCADNCWKSILFGIQNFKIDTIALIACDCEKLTEKTGKSKIKVSTNCDEFNNNQKFEKIDAYWKEKIKNGL